MNSLNALKELGVSPWYDNIERRLLINGGLKKLFDNGIVGVTSNPTIFEKAISSSVDYDEQIADLSAKGLSVQAVYDELTINDVRDAADLLDGVYQSSKYVDGYVSIEVSPEYARDTHKTIEQARYIFKKINRPNIMIKIPGTTESPVAIRTLIKEGINVNVTLLFSLEHYRSAAKSYIEGLRDRCMENKPLEKVNSVASVFVSRVDTQVDKLLAELNAKTPIQALGANTKHLEGLAAIANSKFIYLCFRELFSTKEFGLLKEKGANIQRLLWASTGTKNPAYSDIKYIDGLIGEDTVNTMPQATLDAYLDYGSPCCLTIEEDKEGARNTLEELSNLGIDIGKVCDELQDEGVELFISSFQKALAALTSKVIKVRANV